MYAKIKIMTAGAIAGAVNGLLGAGGGMLLVPLLAKMTDIGQEYIFSSSVSIMMPICLISLIFSIGTQGFDFAQALPYLIGGISGGILAGLTGRRIPVVWLHRVLGGLIIWGGIRYLC